MKRTTHSEQVTAYMDNELIPKLVLIYCSLYAERN